VAKDLNIVVKTLFGLEESLLEELKELGYEQAQILNRALELKGDWEDVYRLNYRCRLAISVLVKITQFELKNEDELYSKAKKVDWTTYFDVNKTFAVKGAVFSDFFKHSQFPMLLVKDAIADVFRDKFNERPNVNIKTPQVMIDVHISNKTVTLSLNTSGIPLYQRGYRQGTGEAPLNEVLAAGLIRLSGWDKKSTFIDPMCGSGTLVIEAALAAANIPSMIEREHYAFKNFKQFDADIWEKVKAEGNSRPVKLDFDIIGLDNDAAVLQKARRNARSAPIGNMIKFDVAEMKDLQVHAKGGTLICNPPYGERIGDEIVDLYKMMGDVFKNELTGFQCWVISSNIEALKHLGLRPERKIKLFNGSLECSFRRFSIYEGTKKVHVDELEAEEEKDRKVETPKPIREKSEPRTFNPERKFSKDTTKKPYDKQKPREPRKYEDRPAKPGFGRTDGKYKKVEEQNRNVEEPRPEVKKKYERREEDSNRKDFSKPTDSQDQSHTPQAPKPTKYAPRIESTKDKIERMKKGRG
jgi:23S rRNA G2445 N2-methylase RlmL